MFNTSEWLSLSQTLAALTLGVGLLTAISLPARAQVTGSLSIQIGQPQPTVIYGSPYPATTIYGNPYPATTIYQNPSHTIYGSPISSPIPVNPITGSADNYSNSYYYPGYSTVVPNSVRGNVVNSTLLYPTVINSSVSDSVLVNPVFVNQTGYPGSYIQRSRIIYGNPGNLRINIGF